MINTEVVSVRKLLGEFHFLSVLKLKLIEKLKLPMGDKAGGRSQGLIITIRD